MKFAIQITRWVGRDQNRKSVIEPIKSRLTFDTRMEAIKALEHIEKQVRMNSADKVKIFNKVGDYCKICSQLFGENEYKIIEIS